MRQFPFIPRLTIVVPVGDDANAFETSLVSVLENRPSGAEVIVAHDGSYDDPFDLADEVRFVVGPSKGIATLVAQAANAARGRFVHVIAEGVEASDGWIEPALRAFDDPEVGVVAPTVVNGSGTIAAAGWRDDAARLCDPLTAAPSSGHRRSCDIDGAFLPASFWRREVIRMLGNTYRGEGLVEASYCLSHLSRSEGWRIKACGDCRMTAETDAFLGSISGFERGRRLRALRQLFYGGGWRLAITASGRAVARAIFSGGISEAFGQAFAPTASGVLTQQIQLESRHHLPQRAVIPMPVTAAPRILRRSA